MLDVLNSVFSHLGYAYQFTRIMQDSGTGPAVLEQIATKFFSKMIVEQSNQ